MSAAGAAPVALFDGVEPGFEDTARDHLEDEEPDPRRRGRSAMPSWDEIVFGARTDD